MPYKTQPMGNTQCTFQSFSAKMLQGLGTHLCHLCLFEGNYCLEQRQATFKKLVLDRLGWCMVV